MGPNKEELRLSATRKPGKDGIKKKQKKSKRENALYTWQTGERVKVKFSKRLFEGEKYSNITLKEQKLVFQEFNCFL